MNMRKRMRTLLKEKDYLFSPGTANPIQAIIVEKAGFDFVYTGGYDASVTILGFPDVGLITETEMVTNARNIARAVNVPVLADADNGYGNAIVSYEYYRPRVAGSHRRPGKPEEVWPLRKNDHSDRGGCWKD
jgi:2-methylisocitrate lyase-like PEP mutase family enzyme